MREIRAEVVRDAVEELFIQANLKLPPDVYARLCACAASEQGTLASGILHKLVENADIARTDDIPICQDTGMAFVFADVGQDVHITGGLFEDAVNAGVAAAYEKGYLRKSVVACPLERTNTGDNTPAVLYTRLCAGDRIRLLAMPKGFGSENMSRIKMFNPTAQVEEIVEFVYDTVYQAGGNPCPPLVIGVGLGGSFDYAAVLAKKALAREVGVHNERYRELLGFTQRHTDFELEPANVVSYGASNWSSTLTLSKGSDCGIEVGDCVMNESGALVGQVIETGSTWATVRTVIDVDMSVGGYISSSGATAMVLGDFTLMQDGCVRFGYLAEGTSIFTGDTVLTSGKGGAFPAGLVVGTITDVRTEAGGQQTYGVITPACDLGELLQVFVIKDFDVVS